jgi:hypothetical protein
VGFNGYVYFQKGNDKYLVHRLVNETPEGYATHHKDGDKNNNDPFNLKTITNSDHIKLTNPVSYRWKK